MKRIQKRRLKKWGKSLLSIVLITAIVLGLIPQSAYGAGVANEDGSEVTYTHENCEVVYRRTNTWGNNANVEISVKNVSGHKIEEWEAAFDYVGKIENIWNGDIVRDENGTVIIAGKSYNSIIEPNQTVTFGFMTSGEDAVPELPKDITVTGIADREEKEEKPEPDHKWKGLYYALFTSDEERMQFNASQFAVKGDIHSNAGFWFQGSRIMIEGRLEAVNEIEIYSSGADNTKISSKKESAGSIIMPDIIEEIKAYNLKDCDVYDENQNFQQNEIQLERPLYVMGALEFNGTALKGSQTIFATETVTCHAGSTTVTGEGKQLIVSETGDIVLNGSEIVLDAVLYAPNGTVYINADQFRLQGRIIAKAVVFQGTGFEVNAEEDDLKVFPFLDTQDQEPVTGLETEEFYLRDEDGTARIMITSLAKSEDGDELEDIEYRIYYDKDNNGIFEEEEMQDSVHSKEEILTIELEEIGKYKVVQVVTEGGPQHHVKMTDDASSAYFEIRNEPPKADIQIQKNKKADILLLHNGLEESRSETCQDMKRTIEELAEEKNIDIRTEIVSLEEKTVQTEFDWTAYDHKGYDELEEHMKTEPDRVFFTGYEKDPLKDFAYTQTSIDGSRKIYFTVSQGENGFQGMEGSGILFNASMEEVDQAGNYQNHRYEVLKGGMEWTEAKEYCESQGGYLATVTSQWEHDYIIEHVLPKEPKYLYWIGGYRNPEADDSMWKWVTGEDFYWTNWAPGEPNNISETVLEMYGVEGRFGQWNDTLSPVGPIGWHGTENIDILCEWDGPHMSGYVLLLTEEGMKLVAIRDVDSDSIRNGSYTALENAGQLLGVFPYDTGAKVHNVVITEEGGCITIEDNGQVVVEDYKPDTILKGDGFGPFVSYKRQSEEDGVRAEVVIEDIRIEGMNGSSVSDIISSHDWTEGAGRFVIDYSEQELAEYTAKEQTAEIIKQLLEKEAVFIGVGKGNRIGFERIRSAVSGAIIPELSADYGEITEYISGLWETADYEVGTYITTSDSISYEGIYQDREKDPLYQQHWEYEYDAHVFDGEGEGEHEIITREEPITRFDKCGGYTVRLKVQDNPAGDNENLKDYRLWSDETQSEQLLVVHNRPLASIQAEVYENAEKGACTVHLTASASDPDHSSDKKKGITREQYFYKELDDPEWISGRIPNVVEEGKVYLVKYEVTDMEQTVSAPAAEVVNTAFVQKIDAGQDKEEPKIKIKVSSREVYKNDTVQIEAYATDNFGVSSFALYINDNKVLSRSGSISYSCEEVGTVTLRAEAEDFNGNISSVEDVVNVSKKEEEEKEEDREEVTDLCPEITFGEVRFNEDKTQIEITGTVMDDVKLAAYRMSYEDRDGKTVVIGEGKEPVKEFSVLARMATDTLESGAYDVTFFAEDSAGNTAVMQIMVVYDSQEEEIETEVKEENQDDKEEGDGNGQGEESGGETQEPDPPSSVKREFAVRLSHGAASLETEVQVYVMLPDNIKEETVKITAGDRVLAEGSTRTSFLAEKAGRIMVVATAVTEEGQEVKAEAGCTFYNLQDKNPPTAAITSPTIGQILTEPVDFVGSACDEEGLDFWKLEYRMAGEEEYILLAGGTEPVKDDVLGHLDTTMLMNGQYNVKLTVQDQGGNIRRLENDYVVEGELKVGAMHIGFTDITASMGGTKVSVNRIYDSRNKACGDFGTGWTLGVQGMEISESHSIADGYEMVRSGSLFSTGYQMTETVSHDVVVTYGDGTSDRFELTFSPEKQALVPISEVTLGYRCVTDQKVKLEIVGDTSAYAAGGELMFYDDSMYDTLNYKLTTEDGVEIYLNRKTGVYKMADSNGNIITVDKDGYHAEDGRSITFTRDEEDRIVKAEDPSGNVTTYTYDEAGDLVAVTDGADRTVTFDYDKKHNLISITDPMGIAVARNEYDDDGRLAATIDADGNRIEYEHDVEGRTELVTDRLGNKTLYVYDDAGNVLSTTDANGNTTKSTYDSFGNVLTKTDAKGNVTGYAYDENGNLTTVTDASGNSVKNTYNGSNLITSMKGVNDTEILIDYDTKGHLSSTTDAEGNVTTYTNDKNGNVTGMADEIGTVMSAKYDKDGNVTETEDGAGNKTVNTYDASGNRLTQTTYAVTEGGTVERTTRYIYNDAGELVQTVDANGNTTSVERNANGKMSAAVDSKGRRTEYRYDKYGNVSEILYSDGTTETFEYDAEGRNTKTTNRLGLMVTYTYDKVGNLLKRTDARGNSTVYTYDKNYNLLTVTTPAGAVTAYTYDEGNRNTAIEDAEGNVTRFTYDEMSLQTSMTDARGNVTCYAYDKNGNRTKVIYADGTCVETEYDERGRTIWQKDAAGRKTEYTYDDSDRLTQVKQNNGSVTGYTYDQTGNLTGITDANGNTTAYVYDENGRRVKTILADGAESTSEYDSYGMLRSTTDYNGVTTTYTYDEEDRIIKETTGTEITEYTYDNLGRLTDVEAGASHITYTYNRYGELSGKTYENGQNISYAYDRYGRSSEIKVTQTDKVLSSAKYGYDTMDRLTRVIAHDGTATVYTYDENGNRKTASFANGEVLTYTYDECNRLVLQKTVDKNGTVIAQYEYTLGKGGEREKATESGACGSVETSYDYDKAGRLTKEVIEKNNEKTTYIYTYDAVGNRTARNENGEKTEYTYNSRNQLVTEASATGTVAYSYDANGSLLNQSGAGKAVTYTYDVYNRLIQYTDGSHTEAYTYDAEGVRRSKQNETENLLFISDTTGSLSQTLAETDGKGNLLAAYTRADALISQTRDGETSYYLYDGHGDVRALLNEAGRITDKYRYNAYGELVEQTGDTENHYLYTGEYYDGTSNLYYLRARYMNPSTGTFISMDTYEGSIYDPDTLHKYLYANGNPVKYSDPSGNMFDFSSTTLATGIQSILNNAVQISYRGVMCGLINMTLTAVMGGSWEQAKSSFVAGFIMGAGISAVRYFAVGTELVTLARFYVLSASANFIFSTTVTVFAITQGYSNLAVTFGVMAILSVAEWCWAYGNYLLIDVYGNKGYATIECDPSGGSESGGYTIHQETSTSSNTLENIVYTDKVKEQMNSGDYHSFPEAVEGFGDMGRVSIIVGGDGISRILVEIEGSYMGKDGVFQYIIEPDGVTCNHRLFVPK